MDRSTLRYALVALLGGVAVVLAAATLPTATRPDRDPGPAGDGDGNGGLLPPPPEDSPAGTVDVPSIPEELLAVVALVVAIATLWYLYHHWRELFLWLSHMVILAIVAFLLYRLFSAVFSSGLGEPAEPGADGGLDGGGGGGSDQLVTTDPSVLSVLFVFVLGLVLLGLLVAMMRTSGEEEPSEPADEDAETAAAVGRAAGRAADRLEEAEDADNEVYRAWVEMTRLVSSGERETKTPGEFAAAAADAGMDPEDVGELTRLFEHVRYGTYDPSAADERRAVGLFRRIESTYAEAES